MQKKSGYGSLLKDGRFEAFLWTQFLGAFNDNVYKMIVSIMAVKVAASGELSSRYLALAGAVFVVPFLLFAGYAGKRRTASRRPAYCKSRKFLKSASC